MPGTPEPIHIAQDSYKNVLLALSAVEPKLSLIVLEQSLVTTEVLTQTVVQVSEVEVV